MRQSVPLFITLIVGVLLLLLEGLPVPLIPVTPGQTQLTPSLIRSIRAMTVGDAMSLMGMWCLRVLSCFIAIRLLFGGDRGLNHG